MATLANKLPYKPSRIKHNHPIDWKIFLAASDTTKFRVKTTKGDFIIVLYKQMAPGTVTNFIDLIQKQFYRKKTFHRVVPNFVIQGGCTRGDGYGSLDYTIRSEFSPIHWDSEGLIGMASVGNHTECQQFFITHSATPHLDGNYTIFGRVIDGMNVVNSIQEGDQIESIEPE
ncbi:MAG: peptidylprolyl isomerase [Saprospiraceae bacterium]|nr:peptidylprolyl isomerase [Saprospiraceae bacterium]